MGLWSCALWRKARCDVHRDSQNKIGWFLRRLQKRNQETPKSSLKAEHLGKVNLQEALDGTVGHNSEWGSRLVYLHNLHPYFNFHN